MATIEPPKGIPKARYRQPEMGHLPKCPARGLKCGPSGGGKGVLVHQMIMDVYRDVFRSGGLVNVPERPRMVARCWRTQGNALALDSPLRFAAALVLVLKVSHI